MAFGAEATAKLGIDTSSVPADLAKAKQAFTKVGQEMEKAGGEHGTNLGGKLVNSLEHKLLGSRHLAGALATALGLNIEKMAEHVTAALVGGTKEAWKEMGELAEENARLIERRMELAMDPKHLQDRIKNNTKTAAGELQKKVNEAGEHQAQRAGLDAASPLGFSIPGLSKVAGLLGIINSEAEDGVEIEKAKKGSIEADIRNAEQEKAIKESHKKLEEYRHDLSLKNLSHTEKLKAINEEINRLLAEEFSGKLSAIEIDERKKKVLELQASEQEEINAHTQRQLDMQQELQRLQVTYSEALRKRDQDEQDLADKKADRGKQTIDEIAQLSGKKAEIAGPEERVDTFGLSEEAAQAKKDAVAIQRQQREAERLRRSGDVAGANALFNQIGTAKQSLVDRGFAKSTEGDEFKRMAEQIHNDNVAIQKVLTEISVVAKGKLKNQ